MNIYRAVVEDNNNPERNGKVRVRIFGIHSDDINLVKTSELPWAEVMQSTSFAGSGIGLSNIPKVGTWVFVTLDHDFSNKPIIIGAISGKSEVMPDTSKGFCDANGNIPKEDRLKEQDINRLARVEKLAETIHQGINDYQDIVTKTDSLIGADVSQVEPLSTNNDSEYPNVSVLETVSGHTIELDDSINNERIRITHKTGTYIEIKPDGSIVSHSKGVSNHIISEGTMNEHIKLSVKKYVEENVDEIIDGYFKSSVAIKRSIATPQTTHIGDLRITGKLHIDGEFAIEGNAYASDFISSGCSLNQHGHNGINVPHNGSGAVTKPIMPE